MKNSVDPAIKRVLAGGWYIMGKELEAFETEFARYNGSAYAVGVASGTEALVIALMALDIGRGSDVIIPVNTAIPTAMAVMASGARPVFVDVDSDSANIDAVKFEKAITRKTKAVIPVHLYGRPCEIGRVLSIAKRSGIAVIEDACQAHGATCKTKKVGSFGTFGAFSFYPTKNLGCFGDGGMITTDNRSLADKVRLIRNYGQSSRYHCDILGINSRLDEIQAAVLRVKLKHLDHSNARRARIASLYTGHLKDIDGIRLPSCGMGSKHVFHLYVIRCADRDNLKKYLWDKGIETQIHYPIPLHLQRAFKALGYKSGDFVSAERLAGEILSLPMFPDLKYGEAERICSHIKDFYKKLRASKGAIV